MLLTRHLGTGMPADLAEKLPVWLLTNVLELSKSSLEKSRGKRVEDYAEKCSKKLAE